MKASKLALLALLATVTLILPQPYSAQSGLTLKGVVLEADTERPLEGVVVTAVLSDRSHNSKTDGAGHFTIELAARGRYLVTPDRKGMVFARAAHLQIPREPGVWVDLSAGPVPELQLRMFREAVITGKVVDSNGKVFPAVQGKVDVFGYGYDPYGKRKLLRVPVVHEGSIGTYGRMNDLGEYRLYGLQPGNYYVSGSGVGVQRFYPGTPDENLAEPIHVVAGQEVRLATITLPAQSQKTTPVRLRFVGPSGESIGNILAGSGITFHTKEGRSLIYTPGLSLFGGPPPAEPDIRTFELLPGSYDNSIGVIGIGIREATELFFGRATFDVGSTGMQLDVQLSRGLRVTGSLTLNDDAGSQPAPAGMFCTLYADALHFETVGASVSKGCLGAAFSPALYELGVAGMPADAYVESAQAAGADILRSGLQLKADTDLQIVLRTPGSVIEGAVRNSSGGKLADAVVALVPEAPFRSAGVLYRSGTSDINGRYQLRGVAPGSYRLFAWTELKGAAYRNEQFMKDFEGKGIAVKIEKVAAISQDLTAF